MAWSPFDGAVDLFILKTFIDQSSVACDHGDGVPAVDVVSLFRSKGSENRYIDGWLTHSAMVRMGP